MTEYRLTARQSAIAISKRMITMNPNELCIEMTSTKNTVCTDGICPTLTARMGTGGGQVNAVLYDRQKQGVYGENECSSTLTAHEALSMLSESRKIHKHFSRGII